jgi:hypothetical protein
MAEITTSTTLQELAVVVSQALVAGGVEATLSGGAAVSIYTDNRYQSKDLDFVSSAAHRTPAALICPLGFTETPSKRLFSHPQVEWLLEFPPGPLGFGARVVDSSKLESIDTPWGQLRVIPPTLCVMDRLAAYLPGATGNAGSKLSGSLSVGRSIRRISGAGAARRAFQNRTGFYFNEVWV